MQTHAAAKAPPQAWLIAISLLAFVPAIQSVMTWTHHGGLTGQQVLVRLFSLVTVCAEIILLMIAGRAGFSYQHTITCLPKRVKMLMAAWLIFAVTSYAVQLDYPVISGFVAVRYILQGFTLAAVIHVISSDHRFDAQRYFNILCGGAVVYILTIAVCALSVADPKTFPWESGLPSATNIRHIGNYAVIFAIAPAALWLFGDDKLKWLYGLMFGAIAMFVAWTGSRAALLGLVVCIAAGCFAMRSGITIRKIAGLIAWFVGGVAASAFIPNPTDSFGVLRIFASIQPDHEISSGRIVIWQNTIIEIIKAPWLGHGAGRYANYMSDLYNFDIDNPHNFILQYFYDWGVVGGSAGLALIAYLGTAIWRRRGGSALPAFAAIAGFSILITIGMLEGMLYHPMKMLLVILMIAPIFRHSPALSPPLSPSLKPV